MVKDFIKENSVMLIGLVFNLGMIFAGFLHLESTVADNTEAITEIEQNKVSKSALDLKEQILNARLDEMVNNHNALENRVRRKLDGNLAELNELTHDNEIMNTNQEARIKQNETELDGVWKFINKFLEELK